MRAATVDAEATALQAPRRRVASWPAAVVTVVVVVIVQAGGLVYGPLERTGLLWPVFAALLLTGVLVSIPARPWRRPSVALLVLFWIVLWCWMPHAVRIAPDHDWATREMAQLGYAATLSLAALLAGLRAGAHWWRVGWTSGLMLVGGIGVWELLTGHHLWVTERRPWPFRGTVAAATYINPNNFGIVLLSMLVALLAWRATARNRTVRVMLLGGAVFSGAMVLASQSRAAALGLVVVLGIEAWRVLRTRSRGVRQVIAEHRRASLAVLLGVVAVGAASFLVPALAARNPVVRMVSAALAPETGAADLLRLRLMAAALRYARETSFLGTGAGSFEPILWNDPASGIDIEANLHNAFLELLVQYGWVVTLPLAVLVVVLLGTLRRSRFSAGMRPRIGVLHAESLGHLVVFAALGCTASSSLTMPVWWLMLANACVCAAAVRDRDAPPDPRDGLAPRP